LWAIRPIESLKEVDSQSSFFNAYLFLESP
jgi:hypothetical protein